MYQELRYQISSSIQDFNIRVTLNKPVDSNRSPPPDPDTELRTPPRHLGVTRGDEGDHPGGTHPHQGNHRSLCGLHRKGSLRRAGHGTRPVRAGKADPLYCLLGY